MRWIKYAFLWLVVFAVYGCSAFKTSAYDPYSYHKIVELKTRFVDLTYTSSKSFTLQEKEVNSLLELLSMMDEYEHSKEGNEISGAMWTLLKDKQKHFIAGYFQLWKENDKLSPVFIEEAKKQIVVALDLLLEYEIKKDKKVENQLLEIIQN